MEGAICRLAYFQFGFKNGGTSGENQGECWGVKSETRSGGGGARLEGRRLAWPNTPWAKTKL